MEIETRPVNRVFFYSSLRQIGEKKKKKYIDPLGGIYLLGLIIWPLLDFEADIKFKMLD